MEREIVYRKDVASLRLWLSHLTSCNVMTGRSRRAPIQGEKHNQFSLKGLRQDDDCFKFVCAFFEHNFYLWSQSISDHMTMSACCFAYSFFSWGRHNAFWCVCALSRHDEINKLEQLSCLFAFCSRLWRSLLRCWWSAILWLIPGNPALRGGTTKAPERQHWFRLSDWERRYHQTLFHEHQSHGEASMLVLRTSYFRLRAFNEGNRSFWLLKGNLKVNTRCTLN